MNNKVTTKKNTGFYLIFKKVHFNALEDGLSGLDEDVMRLMGAYWIGSHDAMILPFDELQTKLKEAMSTPEIASRVLDRLPKRNYDLLCYMKSEGGFLTVEELYDNFPHSEDEDIASILEPLRIRGLIWECRTAAKNDRTAKLFVLESSMDKLPLPSFMEGKLGMLLLQRSKEQSNNLATTFGGDAKNLSRQRNTLTWLKAEIRNPSKLRRFFDSLDVSERKLLKILSLHPDGLTPEELLYEYSLFINKEPENKLKVNLDNLRDKLGLLDIHIREIQGVRKKIKQAVYRLPREINQLISVNFKTKYNEVCPPIPVFKPPDEDFALGTRGKERPTLWIDFQQLLNHLIRCEVGVIRKGGMHKKNLKRILDRLEGQLNDSYLYLDFLFLYAYQRNILYPEGERWKIDIKQILPIQDEEAFYRDFWAFYRNNGSWNDRDSSPLQGVLQKGDLQQIFALRRAVLRLIQDCPVGQWIETVDFFEQLCDREMAFRSGEAPVVSNDPMKEKFRFIKSNLERSLNWIGVVDITTVPSQRINLFRLTEIGSWLLSAGTQPSPFTPTSETGMITMPPNLEIHIPLGFPIEKQLYLSRFTDDQKGRIILNRASIRRGLNENLSIREMQDFLSQHVQGGLPPNVPHLLEEVSEKAGHILIGGEPARLEVHNHNVLDEIMVQKQFLPFISERSSGRKVLLRHDADLRELMNELKRAGYTPRSV